MIYDLSRAERQHRAIQNEKPGPVLESKRCACGKAAPAKALAQYGKCHGCQLADRIATLEDGDLDILRHMVGATDHRPRAHWGFRNEYLVNRRDRAAPAAILPRHRPRLPRCRSGCEAHVCGALAGSAAVTPISSSIADLYQFDGTSRLANVGELVAIATSRAEEVDPKVVNCGFALRELQVDRAALAGPHGHLLTVEEAIVA